MLETRCGKEGCSRRNFFSSFDISGSCNSASLSLFLSFTRAAHQPFSVSSRSLSLREISPSRSRPRDSRRGARRTSISVAASRGFREPRRRFPYRGVAKRAQRWGCDVAAVGNHHRGRTERGLATAKLLSIHGRHAPNWEYAPRSRSTRTDAA